jgi:hypothetical protein
MTGLVITQAALHAALRRVRDDGTYGSLDTLLTLLDPAHAAGGGAAWATTPEAKRPAEPCYDEAGTPAPPTFHAPSLAAEEAQPAHHDHLPADPGALHGAAVDTPAAEGAPPAPKAPPPAQAAEGHTTKPKQPWGRRPICVWTPERVALLRERLPTCLDDEALLAALNALPAQLPVSSVGSMRKQAVKIGVQREGSVIKQLMQAGARKGLSRANEERLKLLGEEPPPDAKPTKARTYAMTAERLEALPALWTDPSLTAGDIQARLNELPGLRITTSTVLYGWALKIGLSTFRRQPKDEAPAAPEPPPAPPQTSPAPAEPEERTPEEQAAIADQALASKHDRAREKLRQLLADKPKDISMAAAGIAAGMKLPLREVMRLMGEVRREGATA